MYLSKYVLHAMHRPDLIPGDKLACLGIRGLLWSYPQCVLLSHDFNGQREFGVHLDMLGSMDR